MSDDKNNSGTSNSRLRQGPSSDDLTLVRNVYQQYLRQTAQDGSSSETSNENLHECGAPSEYNDTDAAGANNEGQPTISSSSGATTEGQPTSSSSSASFPKHEDSSLSDSLNARGNIHGDKEGSESDVKISTAADETGAAKPANAAVGTRPKKVNKDFIERQLNSIARASFLRAKTLDIHAPDPERNAPPNETATQKRRRIERINGRRKRARKLIEMDSLNERLVNSVNTNKRLKTENSDLLRKIDAVKTLTSGGVDVKGLLGKLAENSVQEASATATEIQEAKPPAVAGQATMQVAVAQPQQQTLTVAPTGRSEQEIFSYLLAAGLSSLAGQNQGGELPAGNPSHALFQQAQQQQQHPRPNLQPSQFAIPLGASSNQQPPPQLCQLQPPQQLPQIVNVSFVLPQQQQQQQQQVHLAPQQQVQHLFSLPFAFLRQPHQQPTAQHQHQNALPSGIDPMTPSFYAPAATPNLQFPTGALAPSLQTAAPPTGQASHVATLLQRQHQAKLFANMHPAGHSPAPAVAKPPSPPPKNAKELKAWIKKQKDAGHRK